MGGYSLGSHPSMRVVVLLFIWLVAKTQWVDAEDVSGSPAEAVSEIPDDGGLVPTSRGKNLQSTKGEHHVEELENSPTPGVRCDSMKGNCGDLIPSDRHRRRRSRRRRSARRYRRSRRYSS